MASELITTHRENAEIYTDPEICKQKSLELLHQINLPQGLIPLINIIEVGHNKETGFVWVKRDKSVTHVFKEINRSVWYDIEVTAFVEDRRMKKLTGVQSKELFFWVTICDISIQEPGSGKIVFGTTTGISKSLPVSAFEKVEGEEEKEKD